MSYAHITVYYYSNILWAASFQVCSIIPVLFGVFISYFDPGSLANIYIYIV